jgi:hypothetical protein
VTWRATDYWLSVGETLIQEVEIGRQLFMDDVTGDLVTVATERGTQANLRCTPATAGGGGSVGPYVKPYSIGISIIDTPGHSVGTNDRFVYYVVARICSDPTHQQTPSCRQPASDQTTPSDATRDGTQSGHTRS